MEDYIKVIYGLHRESLDGMVHISDIAKAMGLKKASVCNATDVLVEKGLLQKDRYIGIWLTKSGLQYALYVDQRYDLLMRFFHNVLGVDLETAKRDACGMEHVISVESYRSIHSFLKEQMVI